MALTRNALAQAVVPFYTRRAGILMSAVFGVVVRVGGMSYACSVTHAIDDRDEELAVWSGLPPKVARPFSLRGAARCLARVDLRGPGTGIVSDWELGLLAVPLAGYEGASLDAYADVADGEAALLRPVLIAFPDYEPDRRGVLRRAGNGIAGLICREDAGHCIVSVQGCAGMSGSPAVVAGDGGLQCLGLYMGTPRTTALTPELVETRAQVTKMGGFVRDLTG